MATKTRSTPQRPATKLAQEWVNLGLITLDAGTQLPTRRSKATIDEYAETMREERWEWERNPPVLFSDGTHYYPGDGHHRIEATGLCDRDSILCEVRPGGLLQAKLYSAHANRYHGLKLTRKDKRAKCAMVFSDPALLEALAMDLGQPGSLPSDRVIADYLGVSAPLVGEVRKEYEAMGTVNIYSERVDRNGRKLNTENIGRKDDVPEVSADLHEPIQRPAISGNIAEQFAATLEAAPPPSRKLDEERAAGIKQTCREVSAIAVIECALKCASEQELQAICRLVEETIDNW